MKLKILLSSGVMATLTAAMLTSCNLQKSNPLDLSGPQLPEVPVLSADLITFDVVKSQVLEKHCFECHSKDTNKHNVNLETYANVIKDLKGIRDTVIQKSMPPRRRVDLKLSDSQIKLLVDWIDAGAKENGDGTLNPPVDQPPVVVNPPTTTPPTSTPPITQPPVVIPPIAGEVYFQHVNDYVIKTNCVGCHSVASGNKGKVNLENYVNVASNLEKIKKSILDDFMPPRRKPELKLTAQQKDLILKWIDAGAKEAAPVVVDPPVVPPPTQSPTTTPPVVVDPPVSSEVRFAEIFDQILVPYCLRCHSEQGHNEGDLNLETYENVVNAAFDIKEDIEQGFMPPKKSKQMTPEQKKMILDWLNAGAKEN